MSKDFENIELIELYLEGKLSVSEKESFLFKNRLLIDENLKEEYEIYKQTISVIKENSTNLLQQELNLLDKKLDEELNLDKVKDENKKQFTLRKVLGVAASILIVASLSLYLFSNSPNKKLYNRYYIKDGGLPVTMSISNNLLNTVMNYYKLGETKKAYTEIVKYNENDTILFYKAVFLLELNKNNEANIFFNKVPDTSVFKQKAEYFYALSLLKENKKEESKNILKKILNTKNSRYKEQAKQLLSEKYFQD